MQKNYGMPETVRRADARRAFEAALELAKEQHRLSDLSPEQQYDQRHQFLKLHWNLFEICDEIVIHITGRRDVQTYLVSAMYTCALASAIRHIGREHAKN